MAEIMAVLFFRVMRYDPSAPRPPNDDAFVLSEGHATPLLYAAWGGDRRFPARAVARWANELHPHRRRN
jgi:transketolase